MGLFTPALTTKKWITPEPLGVQGASKKCPIAIWVHYNPHKYVMLHEVLTKIFMGSDNCLPHIFVLFGVWKFTRHASASSRLNATYYINLIYIRYTSRSKSAISWTIWKIQALLESCWKDLFGKWHWFFCIWTPYGSNLHKKWEASAQWLLDLYVSGHVYCSLKREKWICIRQISQKYAGGSCLTP